MSPNCLHHKCTSCPPNSKSVRSDTLSSKSGRFQKRTLPKVWQYRGCSFFFLYTQCYLFTNFYQINLSHRRRRDVLDELFPLKSHTKDIFGSPKITSVPNILKSGAMRIICKKLGCVVFIFTFILFRTHTLTRKMLCLSLDLCVQTSESAAFHQ